MDTLEGFAALSIMAGQSNTQHEIKELNNTLKQMAAAQGIRIKSLEEVKREEEERQRKIEELYEIHRIKTKAAELGITYDECVKLEEEERSERRRHWFSVIVSLFSSILIYMLFAFIFDNVTGITKLQELNMEVPMWIGDLESVIGVALFIFSWLILFESSKDSWPRILGLAAACVVVKIIFL